MVSQAKGGSTLLMQKACGSGNSSSNNNDNSNSNNNSNSNSNNNDNDNGSSVGRLGCRLCDLGP